jgi:putative membrane protein
MGWYGGDHMSGWGWFAMIAGSVLLLALVVAGLVLLARAVQRGPRTDAAPSSPSAEDLLAERFARGEIDEDEYRTRLATLTDVRRRSTSTR